MANTSFTMFPTGTSYQVVPIASAFVAPASTSLTVSAPPVTNTASWDDALSAPITLPFAFPLPTGSTTDITIGSNGFVFFEAVTDTNAAFAYYNSIGDVRDFPARLAPFFGDLDPGAGAGGIFYDVISANEVRITFDQVEEWSAAGGGPTNTFQIVLQSSGGMEVIYQGMALTTAPAITAFTLGNGDRLAPQRDISASLPFQTGDGAIPPVLSTDARPVLGTNINWFLTGITPGTPLVFLVTGVSTTAAPIPLNFLGMPGCFQYITPQDTWLMNIDTNTWTATTPIQIPNNPVFVGANLFGQAAPFTVGLNAAGILSSNGTCIKVGPF